MIGNHQPTAVMGAVFLALYVGFRLWAQRTLAPLRPLLLAAGTIAAGSCCFVIPFAIERAWSAEPTITGGGVIGLAWPNPADLLNYVIWEKGGAGPVSTAYIGMVVLAIACLGAVMLTQRRVRDMAGAKLWGVFVGFTALSLFLVGPQVRPAVFTFTFLCITAACSVDMLIAIFPRRAWLPTLIFAAFSVDAAIAPLQPYTRSDMLSIEREGAELAQRADGQRVVEVTGGPTPASINVTVGPSSTPLHLARVEMLYGPHKLDATKAHNAMVAALSLAATDLRRDGRLSDATEMLLEQYNVGWLVGFEGGKPGLPVSIGAPLDDAVLGRYVKLSHATPILACMRVEQHERPATFDAPPFWDSSFTGVPMAADASAARVQDLALIAAMGIDLGQRVCNTVLMPVVSQGQAWAIRPSATPKVTLQSYRVGAGRVALRVASDLPAFLRIAHPMFPGVRITRNGVPADAAADVFSLIVLPIEAGETEIAIEVQPSWLRRVCIWVSAGAVIALSTNLLRISIVAARRPQLGSVLNQRDG